MAAWLEDLSEDWIPPQSPTPSFSAPVASSASHDSSVVANPNRSRIPRYKATATADPANKPNGATKPLPRNRRSGLSERSNSDTNIIWTAASPESGVGQRRAMSRSFSASSVGSVLVHGTIDHKPSGTVAMSNIRQQDTPEWRRRLLQGQVGYSAQKDLFSPMGLESMFQQPQEPQTKGFGKGKRLSMLKGSEPLNRGLPQSRGIMTQQNGPYGTLNLERLQEASEPSQPNATEVPENMNPVQQEGDSFFENPDMRAARPDHSTGRASPASTGPGGRSGLDDSDTSVLRSVASRTVSGQTEIRNEEFSPVFLSKHNTTDGEIGYRPTDMSHSRAQERFRGDMIRQRRTTSSTGQMDVLESEGNTSITSTQRLPDGLPTGTPTLAEIGEFVSVKRGGYSADGSFQNRPLSLLSSSRVPSFSNAESSMQRNTVDQSTDSILHIPPHRSPSPERAKGRPITPSKQSQSTTHSRSSGSPLKLFGQHDTFTNNRLLRRMSQLEDPVPDFFSSEQDNEALGVGRSKGLRSRLTSVEENSFQSAATPERPPVFQEVRSAPNLYGNGRFGAGQLDGHKFSSPFSGLEESQIPPSTPPDAFLAPVFKLNVESASTSETGSYRTRMSNMRNSSTQFGSIRTTQGISSHIHPGRHTHDQNVIEGKRPPTSPMKDPTPKRRRTLHAVEYEQPAEAAVESVRISHRTMQSVVGKKRKDARHDGDHSLAEPEILAQRDILRPRNPTPSQRRREEVEREVRETTDAFLSSSPRLEALQEHLEELRLEGDDSEVSQAKAIASEVAAFSFDMAKHVHDDGRKLSVNTQDFMKEALKIMNFIRSKNRPRSALSSLEESASDDSAKEQDDTHSSSTSVGEVLDENNKRPGLSRNLSKAESTLKDFEEHGNTEFLPSSMKLLNVRGESPHKSAGDTQDILASSGNIRIHDPPQPRSRGQSDPTVPSHKTHKTHSSHPSVDSSLGRTVNTNASKKSDNMLTLGPEAVEIPKSYKDMVFDDEKRMWVKNLGNLQNKHLEGVRTSAGVAASDDDPLGNIPDLSVDELEEQQRVISGIEHPATSAGTSDQALSSRPVTREGVEIKQSDSSSARSKGTFASSLAQPDTRATSWSEHGTVNVKPRNARSADQPSIGHAPRDSINQGLEVVERRDWVEAVTKPPAVPTLATGKPGGPEQKEQPTALGSDAGNGHGQTDEFSDESDVQQVQYPDQSQLSIAPPSSPPVVQRPLPKPGYRPINRPLSSARKPLPIPRHIASIDEHSELTFSLETPMRPRMAVAVSISRQRPPSGIVTAVDVPPTPYGRADVTFMLSELPEFSMHQVDERRPSEHTLAKRVAHGAIADVSDRYSTVVKDLVRKLTDVEPEEPYWEDLRRLDLEDQGVASLHMLDEFCCRLEDVNLANNSVAHLEGAPSSIRRLNLAQNCLSSLTDWTHLKNLQYLDVSGNSIDNLQAFSCLVHLRELKADDNQVKSLEGLLELDGLIKLSLRRNKLEHIDFEGTDMRSLVELDMTGNQLTAVDNLHYLSALEALVLDDNDLAVFPTSGATGYAYSTIRSLSICNNGTHQLDVTDFSALRSLKVDKNRLTTITGFLSLRHLDTLFVREQRIDATSPSVVNQALRESLELRALYASGNALPNMELSEHLPNLQCLELASCGLQMLPEDLGQKMPNLRVLNLNFNALKDIRGLLGIRRLREAHLVGNRLARLRKTTTVLSRLGKVIKVDLRDNPLTVGFYPTMVETRLIRRGDMVQSEETEQLPYTLPACNSEDDKKYWKLLDEDTKLKRRVYEMLLANSCTGLASVDGLEFDRQQALVKDNVWERLIELGIVKRLEEPSTVAAVAS